jgi:type I restriction enzyme S subunit
MDVLLTMIGTVGEVVLVDHDPNYAIKNIGLFKCGDELKARWLKYYLQSPEGIAEIQSRVGGTTQEYIALGDMRKILIKVPPLPEQKAISAVLSSLDDKIDLLHRQNKTLEAMAETLFRQWFVDNNEIRTIRLGDVVEILDNQRIPLSRNEREKMKTGALYPYYGAASILDYINQYIFDGEYLLLGEDGTVQTDEGFPILQMVTGKCWINNHAHVLKAKKPFSNFLLYIILKNTPITHIVTGAVQPKINQENLKSLEIDIPSDKLIIETVTITDNFWEKIKLNNSQIRTLEKLRDLLLPKLMSGEVRVEYNGD